MKIFTSKQIHELDTYTTEHEPVLSIDLMERAATALTLAITRRWAPSTPVTVFAGPGNNGGDALAVARMLAERQYSVTVYLFNIKDSLSDDCHTNKTRLMDSAHLKQFQEVRDTFDPPALTEETLVVDGLFGSGLNKPLGGGFASLVGYINASGSTVVSIDLPSGLMAEDNTYNIHSNIIRADLTLTLQTKKLCMYFSDCHHFLGEIEVLDIGLSEEWMRSTYSPFTVMERENIMSLLRRRNDFAHKGTMGHALVIAGSYGMAGAAVLATKACLRSGAGKVTAHIPDRNYDIMQISVPEAIVHIDKDEYCFSEPVDSDGYNAIAIGPGLGQRDTTAVALISQIKRTMKPMVLDADALNILGCRRAWLQQLPQGVVLTPHPKEFDRLDGSDNSSDFERFAKAREMAQRLQVYILLKGHYSMLCQPDGSVIFNSTGNSGMATAGSGDVLTGIIVGLMARGYPQAAAVATGMHLHGLAGDIAAMEKGRESLIATDIIEALPKAFMALA
ncbi:MAG: NAD(P)H-hydrate dehydratase [Bacteroidales bacterium]|nr:NAD(P)H-hydrate dehydratase [Bacteroidales bacterium]MCM1146416.1 NAD(P)H-hydrate dehydratase [Bacteroidales bacterium]MCM1205146.1 NAD(P)H-hydrate dehydratase [Bacillota bacterium]MCM1509393.1 NAD(P)H-hydrate dehydratase [Clostridium sp.]